MPQPPEGRALSPELRGQSALHGSRFHEGLQVYHLSKCVSGRAVGAAIIAARGVYALHDYCLHRDSRWRY